ncbi:MAG: hypothetical protein FJ096_08740 [Deltaproteobacteria bacterium]|nr:hypothetical protein [Deltaproteobacteria bacterium]
MLTTWKAPSNQLGWNGERDDLGKGKRQATCAVGSHPEGCLSSSIDEMSGNGGRVNVDAVRRFGLRRARHLAVRGSTTCTRSRTPTTQVQMPKNT